MITFQSLRCPPPGFELVLPSEPIRAPRFYLLVKNVVESTTSRLVQSVIEVGKDEKRDSSKESSVKKTPRGKSTPEVSSQEKMLEVVMTMMSSFSEKLEVMEQ